MNNPSDTNDRADTLRSEIDQTRQRMDQTIDALTSRMKGRHLLDEVIGYFRTESGQQNAAIIKSKVTDTAGSAMNSVTTTIKSNPWPALLIGAGVAWMIYNSRRSASMDEMDQYRYNPYETDYAGDTGYEVSGGGYGIGDVGDVEYGSDIAGQPVAGSEPGMADKVRGKAAQAKEQLQARAAQVKERLSHGADAARTRASQLGAQVSEKSRHLYDASRERVASTANQHPVELGLGCLALGIIAGLAIPTPRKLNETVGPRIDRLRDQARQASQDLMNKGKNVARAAAEAARREAEQQGLTAEALKNKAQAVADSAKQAVQDSARSEGVMPTTA
jgi:hypothetical protein